MNQRVGVFGGTFDPIHCGHLVVAADCHHRLALDVVLFVVAKAPWQKRVGTPVDQRFDMVRRALRYNSWAKASDIELRRDGPTKTIDTLRELSRDGRELFLLLGQNQWENRTSWASWDECCRLAEPCVTPRWLGISSTDVRERLRTGAPVKHLIPDCVQMYIEDKKLYQEKQCPDGNGTPTGSTTADSA